MRRFLALSASAAVLALAACSSEAPDTEEAATTAQAPQPETDFGYDTYSDDNYADTMASNDDRYLNGMGDDAASDPAMQSDIPDSEERPIMQAQVVLDRVGFGPGVIDGKMGMSTENALRGFQEANELQVTGKLDQATKDALKQWERIPATRVVTIPANWSSAEYVDIPEDAADKAELKSMGYESLEERLAERFHTTVDVLKSLNPNGKPAGMTAANSSETPDSGSSVQKAAQPKPASSPGAAASDNEAESFFTPGQQIRVPNIGGDKIAKGAIEDRNWQQTLAALGVGTEQKKVDKIVVSKAGKTLKAYQGEKLVALFTVSSGSSEFPLPLGEWKILGEAYNPPYSYDPEVLGKGDGETHQLPPGPNSPVGIVWIDLSKEHYGIHGTPDPETIGRAQSSGCVRLTNWDAARLAQMVSQSTQVIFEA